MVPNNNSPLPRENYACLKKMKTPTSNPFNSATFLKSPVVSVPSNGVTNNKKKKIEIKKELKSS